MEKQPDLRLGLMTRIFAVLAVGFVVALSVAPVRGVFTEWRDAQERRNVQAASLGLAPLSTGIRQIWNRELGVVDRCTSCHLGSAGEEPLPGRAPFAAHPEIPHDPEVIGCTPCHGGQGRATKKEAAHGDVKHWFEPLLPLEHVEAGCGTCHTAVPVGDFGLVSRGRELVSRHDCLACHRIDGRGGARPAPEKLPDLSGIGLSGVPDGWHEDHLARMAADPDGLAAEAYGAIPPADLVAIDAYLSTLSSMPRLVEGKRLFHVLGCRGCHMVNGVGGTEGADLTRVALKPAEELVFPVGFRGPKTAFTWHVEHLLAPAEVVQDSRMVDQGLSRGQAEAISLFLLSLRGRTLPANHLPPDRVRVEHLGEREFGTGGASLYRVFCSACHGDEGDGRPFGVMGEIFPAVVNPDFLSVASDHLIEMTIVTGRPGRRMAGWGGSESGLRPAEIRSVSAWLRSHEATPPDFAAVGAAEVDPELGRRIYRRDCEVCHGARGEGGIGPTHQAPAFGALASEEFVFRTLVNGRPGTAMSRYREFDAKALASLIARVRGFSGTAIVDPVHAPAGNPAAGEKTFAASCAACHGARGEGGTGPAIGKAGFWRVADAAFVVESHLRGRCRDGDGKQPPPVPRSDLANAAAWLSKWSSVPETEIAGRTVHGEIESGRRLYMKVCAGCHGREGEGKEAPALANPEFLRTANDGYLQATIVRGRRDTAMPGMNRDHANYPRLSGPEIDDIVTFVRSFADREKESE